MNAAAHNTIASGPSIEEMMALVFGDLDNLPMLDVQPVVRALKAHLRGRAAVTNHRKNAKRLGQTNPVAEIVTLTRLVGNAVPRANRRRWYQACNSLRGPAASVTGQQAIAPPRDAAKLDNATISAVTIPAASDVYQHARERDRTRGATYVRHFPSRIAHSRSRSAVVSAA
jgi:hypothetical protein